MEEAVRTPSRLVLAVGLGQVCCLLLTVTGVTSHILADKGVSFPTTQSTLNYALLSVVFGAASLGMQKPAQHSLWKYALLALFDVEANFLVVMAYRYTSITSVSLSSAFSVPIVMILSFWVFGSRYRPMHLLGASLAIVGLVYLVLSDHARGADSKSGNNPLLGDLLVIAGASMYAGTNVVQEHLLGSASLVEVLSRLGLIGAVFSLIQAAAIEGSGIFKANWTDPSISASMAGFVLALFMYYSVEPFILRLGGSATLNLSLLAANFWDAAARVIFLGGFTGTGARDFFTAVLLVVLGLGAYSFAGPVMIASREAAKPGSEEHEGLGEVDPSPLLCDAEADRSCEARDARESSCPSLRGAQERLASG